MTHIKGYKFKRTIFLCEGITKSGRLYAKHTDVHMSVHRYKLIGYFLRVYLQ